MTVMYGSVSQPKFIPQGCVRVKCGNLRGVPGTVPSAQPLSEWTFVRVVMGAMADALLVGMWFICRWNEVTRRIEMWISISELNELGEYAAVELHQAKDVNTGGVFQLRQVCEIIRVFFTHPPYSALRVSRNTSIFCICVLKLFPFVSFHCHGPHSWRLHRLRLFRVTPVECRSQ